jgi:hypothetical protein
MNKKSIAQTMKDAGFKPLSKEQQRQNLEALTPVWSEEQNAMTTKTDRARECAKEIRWFVDQAVDGRGKATIPEIITTLEKQIITTLEKHFPPSVPGESMVITRPRFWSKAECNAWQQAIPDLFEAFDNLEAARISETVPSDEAYVPVSKLESLQRYDDWRPDPNGDSVNWTDIEALIAEAK